MYSKLYSQKLRGPLLAMALSLGLPTVCIAGPLDGLEMDVLDAKQTPAQSSPRIALPQIGVDDPEFRSEPFSRSEALRTDMLAPESIGAASDMAPADAGTGGEGEKPAESKFGAG